MKLVMRAAHFALEESPSLRAVAERARRAAASDVTLLLCGESGTGKELLARALHEVSRPAQPFVALNCASLSAGLLESELFGHVRGAFTGAQEHHAGVFLEAGHGTVFLDEVGELPLELQPRLLRALQEHAVRPVGGTGERPFAARVIAATNVDLEAAVASHRFRADLFFRLDVVRLELPPLRSRPHEIGPLARAAERQGRAGLQLSAAAHARLEAWSWPGNIRELANCIESAVLLSDPAVTTLDVEHLPRRIREARSQLHAGGLKELALEQVHRALDACAGNKTRAARALGVDRRTLHRMLAREHQ